MRSINYGRRGSTSKGNYLEAKKKDRRAVYKVECKVERKRLGNVLWGDDQKCDVPMILKRWAKESQAEE